jgi:hypothetical protein
MKSRVIVFGLAAALMSTTSGCYCLHQCFPNLGWRFHQCCPTPAPCGTCAPCGPCCGPVGYHPPMVVPDCPGCAGGPTVPQPAGFPPVAYPPVIGNPMPLPGQPGVTGTELHQPTQVPSKMGGGN